MTRIKYKIESSNLKRVMTTREVNISSSYYNVREEYEKQFIQCKELSIPVFLCFKNGKYIRRIDGCNTPIIKNFVFDVMKSYSRKAGQGGDNMDVDINDDDEKKIRRKYLTLPGDVNHFEQHITVESDDWVNMKEKIINDDDDDDVEVDVDLIKGDSQDFQIPDTLH